jgi:hypothetical protein
MGEISGRTTTRECQRLASGGFSPLLRDGWPGL